MGPNCPYASTIEVAYPLRPFAKLPEGFSPMTRRVVIPEPSRWDVVSPFLYQGFIELREDGQMCDRISVRHGLRAVQIGAYGVRWNGDGILLHAVERDQMPAAEVAQLREVGVNTIVTSAEQKELVAEAERVGMLVLVKVKQPDADVLRLSPAILGWVLPSAALANWPVWHDWLAAAHKLRQIVGMELETVSALPLPPEVRFVMGPDTLPPLADRPRLMRSLFQQAAADAELGWLDDGLVNSG
jgi:hypothetical protein